VITDSSFNSTSESTVDVPFDAKVYPEQVDYATSLKFDENSGRKYVVVDSIKNLIDGDTTHFNIKDSDKSQFQDKSTTSTDGIMKIRYLGIDTPESTGQVEEWGKTASNFNKSKLKDATSIIVESNDENWNLDSTGTRYLAYVWYKTASSDEYINLNLEIMQEGLAYAKSITSLCYSTEFSAAFNQAKECELGVFSKASSKWQINSDGYLQESTGYVVGSTNSNQSLISFSKSSSQDINHLQVYDNTGKVITSINKIVSLINTQADTIFHLGINIDNTIYYATGKIENGLGEVTSSLEQAHDYYIEKDASKTGYYSIYELDTEGVKHFFTLNSANNIDYMYRDANFYYGEYIETTIRGLRTYKTDDDEFNYQGKLVRFSGIVSRVIDSTTFYVQDYDEETETTYGMQIYVGYSFSGNSLIVKGNELSICGTYSEFNGTYQVSGLEYMVTKPTYEKNTRLISQNNEVTVKTITALDLTKTTVEENNDIYGGLSYTETLTATNVHLDNVTVTKVYTTASGTSQGAMTLTVQDSSGNTTTIRTEVIYKDSKKSELVTESDLLNKTISVDGIVDYYNGSYQVKVFAYKDITFEA
jgi:endonuclease YncB( thermonuclease family)